jgi:hypothetical protein
MQIEIDGTAYEFPSIGSFDLDEDRIFFKGTGLHAEDVWLGIQDGGDLSFSALVANEGFLTAMAHIAYRREHPNETDETIFRVVGRQKRLEMIASLANSIAEDEPEADTVPLADGTTGPTVSSEKSNDRRPSTPPNKEGSSGKPSGPSSVPPVVALGITGTGVSDMSSTSDRIRQAS